MAQGRVWKVRAPSPLERKRYSCIAVVEFWEADKLDGEQFLRSWGDAFTGSAFDWLADELALELEG